MKAFIVGGYVRDKLLGLEPVDRDWVVVGETPGAMLEQGFRMAGKGFPVFLHPRTHEVYALARTGREGGELHGQRRVFADPDVSLEDDLSRRDLTINAMAMTPDGELIDPFGGASDLKNKTLRHVGPSFREDPVRVLRMARFAARYGFHIAEETQALVDELSQQGQLDNLTPERVWSELAKALAENRPALFFRALHDWCVLARVFPEIEELISAPGCRDWDLFGALDRVVALTDELMVRFALLVHRFGCAGGENAGTMNEAERRIVGAKVIADFCERLVAPVRYRRLGVACSTYCRRAQDAFGMSAQAVVELFEGIGALKRPQELEHLLLVCRADAEARDKGTADGFPQGAYLRSLLAAASSVSSDVVRESGVSGPAFGEKMRELRISSVAARAARYRRED